MYPIAGNVISKFGGAYKLAELIGIDPSQVYRWTYPKSRGGTDGKIPARHFDDIIDKAAEKKISLCLEELVGISSPKKLKSINSKAKPSGVINQGKRRIKIKTD